MNILAIQVIRCSEHVQSQHSVVHLLPKLIHDTLRAFLICQLGDNLLDGPLQAMDVVFFARQARMHPHFLSNEQVVFSRA